MEGLAAVTSFKFTGPPVYASTNAAFAAALAVIAAELDSLLE